MKLKNPDYQNIESIDLIVASDLNTVTGGLPDRPVPYDPYRISVVQSFMAIWGLPWEFPEHVQAGMVAFLSVIPR